MITNSHHVFRTDWNLDFNYSFDSIQKEIKNNLHLTEEYQFKPTFDEYSKKDLVLSDKNKYKEEYEAMQKISQGFSQLVLVGYSLHKRTGQYTDQKLEGILPNTFSFLKCIPRLRSAALNILKPGTIISPHTGLNDGCIKGHLVIKSNNECKLFIQLDEVHPHILIQEDGDCYFFDDSPLHWAGNKGKEDRYILVFDFFTSEYEEFKPLENWISVKDGGPRKIYSY